MSSACPQLLLSLTKNTQIHISSMMSINQPKFIFFLSPYLDHSMAGPPTKPLSLFLLRGERWRKKNS